MPSISTKALLALLLSIFVLGLWTLKLRSHGPNSVDVELPVQGFDPLDPISGHYVSYRLAMGRHDPCRPTTGPLINRQEERCLCFNADSQPQPNWAGSCATKPDDCHFYLKGSCPWSGFTAGVERFYIPPSDSAWFPVVPPKSTVILTLKSRGQALVRALRPENEDYDAWIQRKKAEQRATP